MVLDVEDPQEWGDDGEPVMKRVVVGMARHEEHHVYAKANKVAVVCAMMKGLDREQQKEHRRAWEERDQVEEEDTADPTQRIHSEAAITVIFDCVMPPPKGVRPAEVDLGAQERAIEASLPEGWLVLRGRSRVNQANRRTMAGRAMAWGKGKDGGAGGGKGKGKGKWMDKGKGKGKALGKGKGGAGQQGEADSFTVQIGSTGPTPAPIGATLMVHRYVTGSTIYIQGAGVPKPMFRIPGMLYCKDLEPQGFYSKPAAAAKRAEKWKPDTKIGNHRLEAFCAMAEEVGGGGEEVCTEAGQRFARHASVERALCSWQRACPKQPCVGMGAGNRTAENMMTMQRDLNQRTAAIGSREAATAATRAEAAAKATQQQFALLAAKHQEEDRAKRAREERSMTVAVETQAVNMAMEEVGKAGEAWAEAAKAERAATEWAPEARAKWEATVARAVQAEEAFKQAVVEETEAEEDYKAATAAEKEAAKELKKADKKGQQEELETRLLKAAVKLAKAETELGGARGEVSDLEVGLERCRAEVKQEEDQAAKNLEEAEMERQCAAARAFAAEMAARRKLGPELAAPVTQEEAPEKGTAAGGEVGGDGGMGVKETLGPFVSQASKAQWEVDKESLTAEDFLDKYARYYKEHASDIVGRRTEAAVKAMVEAAVGAATTREEAEEAKGVAEAAAKEAARANKEAVAAETLESMMDKQLAKLRSPASVKKGEGKAAAAEKSSAAAGKQKAAGPAGSAGAGSSRMGAKRSLDVAVTGDEDHMGDE